MDFSNRLAQVQKSGIREIFDLAESLPNYVNLGIGEPDFRTPAFVTRAAKKAIDDGFSKYTPNKGLPELREEISRKLKKDNGMRTDPGKNIIVTAGATQAIFVLMQSLLNTGDEVILPTPLFTAYRYATRLAGGTAVEVQMSQKNGFALDYERIEHAVTERTKMVVINSPCNPTGASHSKESILRICELAARKGLYIVSDEIYESFLYDKAEAFSPASSPEFGDRVITINGFSKKYSMTGWRIGYAAADEEIIKQMTLINMYNAVCASSFVQIASIAALKHSQAFFSPILKRFNSRRRVICEELEEMGLEFAEPKGAFYVFPALTGIKLDPLSFCKGLLSKYRVSTVPGSSFGDGGEGHIRISYSIDEKILSKALTSMKRYVKEVRSA